MKPPEPDKPEERRLYQHALGIGFTWAAAIALFTFGGYWLDRRMGGGVFWTVASALLGLLYCGYELWKLWREVNRPK
jgi:hypothetical protein